MDVLVMGALEILQFSAVGPGYNGYISFPISYFGSGGVGITCNNVLICRIYIYIYIFIMIYGIDV